MPPVTFSQVWRIFSGVTNTILSIKKSAGKYFLYTEIFEIEIEGAIKEKEIILSNEKELVLNASNINEHIKTRFDNYRMGFITTEEFFLDFPIYDFKKIGKDMEDIVL